MSWLDEAPRSVRAAAAALGLPGDARRGLPCPACGAARRDARRGAVGLRRDDRGWRCHRCGEGGDAIDLVAWHVVGARFRALDSAQRGKVRDWFGRTAPSPPRPVPARPAPARPPRAEVDALWSASLPLRSCLPDQAAPDADAAQLLRARGLLDHVSAIDQADLARLTPLGPSIAWPSWWPRGRAKTWRLLVRGWDTRGVPVSLHARATVERPGQSLPKVLWPGSQGGPRYEASGLFFADPLAQALLQGLDAPIRSVLLCEGLTDWLSAAAWCASRAVPGVAVMGGVSGSFPALAQLRWPSRPLDIVLAMDHDPAGERYVAQVQAALPGRALRRTRGPV